MEPSPTPSNNPKETTEEGPTLAEQMTEGVEQIVPEHVRNMDFSRYDLLKDVPWLQTEILGSRIYSWLLAAATFFLVFLVFFGLRQFLLRRSRKKGTDDSFWVFVGELMHDVKIVVLVIVALYAGASRLDLLPFLKTLLGFTALVAITVQLTMLTGEIAQYLLSKSRIGNRHSPMAQNTAKNISTLCKIFIWILGILFILGQLGYDVTTLIAGLGIGGIAIALAAQAILGDTFNSFVIAMDKPFEIGDFIIIGDKQGTVEYVGLKTTRVRALSGELLVFGNSDISSARLQNFKRMTERRVVFSLGVTYGTPVEKLKKIPKLLKAAVEETDNTRFDRAHFFKYGAFSLDFEIVYFVLDREYPVYMDAQQSINLKIAEKFEAEGLEFAFPTQTIHLEKSGD